MIFWTNTKEILEKSKDFFKNLEISLKKYKGCPKEIQGILQHLEIWLTKYKGNSKET